MNCALRLDFAPLPLLVNLLVKPSMSPPRVDGAPRQKEPDGEGNTLLTYTKMIHFLVSLLCWPKFYNPSCLVLPHTLGGREEDVFCNKKDSELSECHVFSYPEQCSFIAL